MIEVLVKAIIVVVILVLVWIPTYFVSKGVADHKMIQPRDGVECVVVSRMFNTSIDCYQVEKRIALPY